MEPTTTINDTDNLNININNNNNNTNTNNSNNSNSSSSSNVGNNNNISSNGVEEDYILSIDVGTTNIRAVVFDKQLNIISKCIQNIPLIIDSNKPGYIEQDPILMWESCKWVVKQAIAQSSPAGVANIKCLGISNQRSTFLTWRKDNGQPLHNLITWQDTRAANICKKANESMAVKGIHGATKFVHFMTGKPRYLAASNLDFSTAHTSPRLAWVLENIEEAKIAAREKNMLFGTIDTWLLWNLTGGRSHCTDYSNMSTTNLYDPFEMSFNKVVFYLFNIPLHIMPKVCDTSYQYGDTVPELFGKPIPITAMAGDQQSAMFGQCCFNTGDTKITIGTGCFVDINTGSQARASKTGMYPLIGWKIGSDISYIMEGKGMAAGTVVDWAQSFGMFSHVAETSGLASSVPHTQGVVFVPAFTGLAPPQNDPTARGLLIGMTPSTRREHVIRALLESFGYRTKEIIDGIGIDNYVPITRLVADGGVSQNDFALQFASDMCGMPIDRAHHSEMTAAGACMLAGLGLGIWKSKEDLIPLRKSSRIFESRVTKDYRKKLFKRWQRAVRRSMHWASEDVFSEENDGFGDSDSEQSISSLNENGSNVSTHSSNSSY